MSDAVDGELGQRIGQLDQRVDRLDHRVTVLTWAVGVSAALTIATLGMIVTMSYQVGQLAGEITVLVGHVQMR